MNRAERRRQARRQHHRHVAPLQPDADYGVQVAWCADDVVHVAEAKRQTHDRLIATMGARRTGGVQWRVASGDDAEQGLSLLWKNATLAEAAVYRRIRGLLREHGGCLVVAMAPGRKG